MAQCPPPKYAPGFQMGHSRRMWVQVWTSEPQSHALVSERPQRCMSSANRPDRLRSLLSWTHFLRGSLQPELRLFRPQWNKLSQIFRN